LNHERKEALAALVVCLILGAIGFIVNWFRLELLFNLDFIFGSTFAIFAILRLGGFYGVLAGFIASVCTYFLWHHPWGIVICTCEVLFVAVLYTKRKGNPVIYDIAYWVLIGVPMVYVFYHGVMGFRMPSTFLFMLKQFVNGIFNALVATILFYILRSGRNSTGERIAYSQLIFVMMVSLVLVPALLFFIMDMRNYHKNETTAFVSRLSHTTEIVRSTLSDWIEDHRHNVQALASLVSDPNVVSFREMQHYVETVKAATQTCSKMAVMNRDAVIVASSPTEDENGNSILGKEFLDPSYVAIMKETRKPYIPNMARGKIGSAAPILLFLAPILYAGEYKGYCAGVLEVSQIASMLAIFASRDGVDITLIDGIGNVIAATLPDQKIMEPVSRPYGTNRDFEQAKVVHWIPSPHPPVHPFQQWRESIVYEMAFLSKDYGWKVVVESPFLPVFRKGAQHGTQALALLSALIFITVLLSHLFSKGVVASLVKLQNTTRSFPNCLSHSAEISWPESRIKELAALSSNFREMALALSASFSQQEELNENLEQRVRSRTEDLNREIEERRRTEASLRESEEKYRALFLNPLFAIGIFDSETLRFIDVNDTYINTYGYTKEELLDRMTLGDITMTGGAETMPEGSIFLPLQYHRKKDGAVFPVEIVGGPYFWQGRRVMFVLSRDITDKARTDEALKESEERFRTVFEEGPLGMAIITLDHRFSKVNSKFCEMLGYTEEELSSLDFSSVTKWDESGHAALIWDRILANEIPFLNIENTYITKTGEVIWGQSTLSVIRNNRGTPLYGLIIVENITRRKRVEQELDGYREHLEVLVQNRTSELAQLNEQLRWEIAQRKTVEEALRKGQEELHTLAAKLSESEEIEKRRLALELHDRVGQNLSALNISLNILKNLLPLNSDPMCRERIRDSLALVRETSQSIRDVMSDLRPPVLDDYGLAAALRWYADIFRSRTSLDITVQAEGFSARLPLHVETAFFRIFQESLSNVARHAKATSVSVNLEELKSGVRMSVQDNGIGFDMTAEHNHDGQPRWGLMGMRERAQGIGGKLRIKSRPGKGTRVVVIDSSNSRQ